MVAVWPIVTYRRALTKDARWDFSCFAVSNSQVMQKSARTISLLPRRLQAQRIQINTGWRQSNICWPRKTLNDWRERIHLWFSMLKLEYSEVKHEKNIPYFQRKFQTKSTWLCPKWTLPNHLSLKKTLQPNSRNKNILDCVGFSQNFSQ